MLDIILGYIWHYLQAVWPYFVVIGFFSLVNIGMFHAGRLVEWHQWRREIQNGKRLGELVEEQLKKRDTRIQQLTIAIKYREDQIERVGVKHKQLIGLSQEIINVAISEDSELLRRRKRA